MKKEYSKPAILVINAGPLEMLATSVTETEVNTGGGYGPGGSASSGRWKDVDDWESDEY